MRDVTVVVTVLGGQAADARSWACCLAAPGLREIAGSTEIVTVGESDLVDAQPADVRFVRQGRPGRASARNTGLAVVTTDLVAFVDGHCRPAAGWLAGLVAGASGHAAAVGRTRADRKQREVRLVAATGRPSAGYLSPPVSPAGGSAIFDRRLLREVGAFSQRVRYWDDLYITARLIGYGQTVGEASLAVVEVATAGPAWQRAAEAGRPGYWLADLQRSGELGHARVHPGRAAGADRLGAAGRVLRSPRGHGGRLLPVITRTRSADPRVVHLTIDDGPGPGTARLLRVLRRHDASADFFVIGDQARRYPGLTDDIQAEGHAVHNHSFTHRQFDMLGQDEIVTELDRTARLVAPRASRRPPLVRLPYGAGDDDQYVHDAIRRWRPSCELAGWSIDSFDYKAWPDCRSVADAERAAHACADRVLQSPELAGSVVLMHDGAYGARRPLAERFAGFLLEALLTGLAQRGLSIAPLQPSQHPA